MTSNWARSYDYQATSIVTPRTVDEVQSIVATTPKVRALGTRHSFTGIADTTGTLVSLAELDVEPRIDDAVVHVPGGMRYGELSTWLQARGKALHNLASLPHISVAGAVATGTHGSGDSNGTLAAAVAAIDLVTASGELVTLRRGDPDFAGSVVSLGALGVVTSVALDIQPSFDVRQDLYDDLPWDSLLAHLDDVTSAAYSVSVFTSWQGSDVEMLWLKSRMDAPEPPALLHGAARHAVQRHMLPDQMAVSTTPQGGIPGPWNDRLAHFKLEFTPSNGEELQSEYLVPRRNAVAALEAVRELRDSISPLLLITELRTMAADDLWLSGAYETDAIGIHFTWKKLPEEVAAVLPSIEAALLPLGARPHWGKVFDRLDPANYPQFDAFLELRDRFDPARKFYNEFLRTHLAG
jgi:xylitol oxidase